MKERFAAVRRAHFDHDTIEQRPVVLGRLYRRVGRVCLMAAAVCGAVEVTSAAQGGMLPPVTLRSILDLPADITAANFVPLRAAIEFTVDSPLWVVLLIVAAIPYALAIYSYLGKSAPVEDRAKPGKSFD